MPDIGSVISVYVIHLVFIVFIVIRTEMSHTLRYFRVSSGTRYWFGNLRVCSDYCSSIINLENQEFDCT